MEEGGYFGNAAVLLTLGSKTNLSTIHHELPVAAKQVAEEEVVIIHALETAHVSELEYHYVSHLEELEYGCHLGEQVAAVEVD